MPEIINLSPAHISRVSSKTKLVWQGIKSTEIESIFEHSFSSLTVTVYSPIESTTIEEVVSNVFHRKLSPLLKANVNGSFKQTIVSSPKSIWGKLFTTTTTLSVFSSKVKNSMPSNKLPDEPSCADV